MYDVTCKHGWWTVGEREIQRHVGGAGLGRKRKEKVNGKEELGRVWLRIEDIFYTPYYLFELFKQIYSVLFINEWLFSHYAFDNSLP
jgi:hypothetical protein